MTYLTMIVLIYSHHHLDVPPGKYAESLVGEYEVVATTQLQIPEVFRGSKLEIRDDSQGVVIANDQGSTLRLRQGADGVYFSENFDPVGARILPGIARNWNEGRLRRSDDRVIVDGFMLEKGLMLFFVPFQDVTEWKLELKRIK